VASGDYKPRPDPTCAAFEPVHCDVFITEATFALPVFRHPDAQDEIARLLKSLARNPDRAHLVGVYSLGKAQRVIRLIRDAGYDEAALHSRRAAKALRLLSGPGRRSGRIAARHRGSRSQGRFRRRHRAGPALGLWRQMGKALSRSADYLCLRLDAGSRPRRQRGVELPLVISDHADWDELTDTIRTVKPGEVWVTHGREEALVRWCELEGFPARPLNLVGYEDEGD
jgi:putative mRNA 3-end processing factor